MLSLTECRAHLTREESEKLSDEAISLLREQLQIFSEIFVEHSLTKILKQSLQG